MSAIGKKKKGNQLFGVDTPEEILQLRRDLENRVGDGASLHDADSDSAATGLAAERAIGALCYMPKSIHRLASRAAEDRELTSKRFFLESMLIGLEQQGVITLEQREQALAELPPEYGWKGRSTKVGH